MSRTTLLYGVLLGILLSGFKLLEFYFFSYKITLETYLGIVAVIFLLLGLFAGRLFFKGNAQTTSTNPPINKSPNLFIHSENATVLGLSERELAVLALLGAGYSNQEIADKLFVSLSTIKTHISNIYLKMDVKRRTQAVNKAKSLNIIG
jgi:DNA-binding CsgD family transcriptional regulator